MRASIPMLAFLGACSVFDDLGNANATRSPGPCRDGEVEWDCVVQDSPGKPRRTIVVCAATAMDAEFGARNFMGSMACVIGCTPRGRWMSPGAGAQDDACTKGPALCVPGAGESFDACVVDGDCASCVCDDVFGQCAG